MKEKQVAKESDLKAHLSVDPRTAHGIMDIVKLGVFATLTVDTNSLCVDPVNNRVGVGTVTPAYLLDVAGIVNATTGYYVNGVQVLQGQGAAIASPGDPGAPTPTTSGYGFASAAIMNAYTTAVSLMRTNYNLILTRLRAHGIINT